jgi:hypothetical protein
LRGTRSFVRQSAGELEWRRAEMGVTMTLIHFLGASMAGWPEKMGGQRMSTHSHAGKLVGRRKELDGPHE